MVEDGLHNHGGGDREQGGTGMVVVSSFASW